jgi:hypothetical protein
MERGITISDRGYEERKIMGHTTKRKGKEN